MRITKALSIGISPALVQLRSPFNLVPFGLSLRVEDRVTLNLMKDHHPEPVEGQYLRPMQMHQ